MTKDRTSVKLTKHAKIKIIERNITLTEIKKILTDPIMSETDKFDPSLAHYVGMIKEKFLRVIGRWLDKRSFLVVSAFYDRRLKRSKHDKD
jgi:hypothetical protein